MRQRICRVCANLAHRRSRPRCAGCGALALGVDVDEADEPAEEPEVEERPLTRRQLRYAARFRREPVVVRLVILPEERE